MPMNEDGNLRAEPADRDDLREAPERKVPLLLLLGLIVAVAAAAWWFWHAQERVAAPEQASPPVVAAFPPAPPVASNAPAVKYPLTSEAGNEPVAGPAITDALINLLGRKAVEGFLRTDDFARRFVATVDNLGREQAPSALWPVVPTPGRFTVEDQPGGAVIAHDNAARYTPLVLLAGTLDAGNAAKLYRRMYPLLQQAYRELGYGDRYLNDRVVEVIDLLLQTPEPADPPRLQLVEVKGSVPSIRPWVRYEFADPGLERLAAGQKILVRVGPVNQQRLKGKLRELREQLVLGQQSPVGGR